MSSQRNISLDAIHKELENAERYLQQDILFQGNNISNINDFY